MGATSLDDDAFKSIARLPSREVLIGQFAGVVASPITGLVRGLGSMIQGLALQLGQIAEQGPGNGRGSGRRTASEAPRRPLRRGAGGAQSRGAEAAEEARRGAGR